MTSARGLAARFAALGRPRRWAALAGAGWAALVLAYGAGYLATAAGGGLRGMLLLDAAFLLIALVLPPLLFWLAAVLVEELARQREIVAALAEAAAPLFDALGATRAAVEAHAPVTEATIREAVQAAAVAARGPDLAPKLDRVLAGVARLEVALQRRAAREPEPAEPPPAPKPTARPEPEPQAEPEPDLPLLAEPAAPERLATAELIRALDFPRDADDGAGFDALRAALRHHGLAQMLQAAEDVLNLLSQEGVFVDELPMAPVDVRAWRRFMAGARGPEVGAVGGIHDPEAMGIARRLMRSDTIFRDTALFFQRRFDAVLGEFAGGTSDAELAALAGTRSGRAFMLLARLSGSLD